ncbi:MAG TPA: lipopolysaccharide kinase InaA family protein [Kiritimatiellia bacterium]|nr:lipopolysaccharide kinase InaA family protein [Kiritimatiellia bacterium]HMP33560.1 lipopolysaccharide kinase InaA family protein [Kiritimatiellia bacterium]
MPVIPYRSSPLTGALYAGWTWRPEEQAALEQVSDWLAAGDGLASLGRHALATHTITIGGVPVSVAIKSFARGSWWRDRDFARRGSKARRSFDTAVRLDQRGVGTPKPIAYLDRWEGGRLLASYYLCAYEEGITSFRDELNRLYREDPLCRRIMELMETVALAVADLHDAGVCHRDLGNQNILLRRDGPDAWKDVRFIDLNRAQLADELTLDQRARDLSRIDLPSDFFRVFKCMYFRHQHPPRAFSELEARYRRRFALHTASRRYRHPIREARQRKKDALLPEVPRGRELWVWDDRSVQAVSTMLSRERHAYYPAANNFYVARGLFKALGPVWSRYRDLRDAAFRREVALEHRIGVAIGTAPGAEASERPWLEAIGRVPVLVRLYRHERDAVNEAALAEARHLHGLGHRVMAALVQDRAAVRDPAVWCAFLDRNLPALSGLADVVEVGHAVNRVKWGVWDVREYRRLLDPVIERARALNLSLSGPAAIDFEYHTLAGLLDQLPREGLFDALSHHLYVDRRGAPENRQGPFSAVEKFALAKAIAAWSPAVRGDRLIVSEVNWPILGTGPFSPVNSPYIIPGSHANDPSVDEQAYANYLVRYLALALCSGLVDAVYWWRLAAHGFGLVDNHATPWRARPAHAALVNLVRHAGRAVFLEKMASPDGVWLLRFRGADGRGFALAWAHPKPVYFTPPFRCAAILDRDGRELARSTGITLDAKPCYFLDIA